MEALMMNDQLTLDRFVRRAGSLHARKAIVSRLADKSVHRYQYADFATRVLRLMDALRRLGIKPGDRVASFAWNTHRHFELYFAVPAMGAILHTINIRLSGPQIVHLATHAEDRVLFVDRSLAAAIAPLRDQLRTVHHVVVMDDRPEDEVPAMPGALDYEDLIASAEPRDEFPALSENQGATLCYTSGTTGVLKGVLYSHRSIILHALALGMADSLAFSMADTALQIVPMFHVNGWGIPYIACITGAKLVLPGCHVLGAPVIELIASEKVTIAAAVPSIWHLLFGALRSKKSEISSLGRILVGGAAAPRSLIESYAKELDIQIIHAWGMTEVSPIGTINRLQPYMAQWPEADRFAQLARQGPPACLVEVEILDDDGTAQPHDGASIGELVVRGPWVARAYFRDDSVDPVTSTGWLRTGDVATIDEHGYVAITDRKKDLIKTRGEWISSIEMEHAVMGHPGVLEAAVVGRPDPVRGEAVVLFVVARPDHEPRVSTEKLTAFLREHFQSWQVPRQQDVHFIDALPKTTVGKFDKRALRARLAASE